MWFEACSAVPRIKISLDAIAELPDSVFHYLRDLGSLFEEFHGALRFASHTADDISYTLKMKSKFLSMFPWATDVDVHFFLLGREMGIVCGLRQPAQNRKGSGCREIRI